MSSNPPITTLGSALDELANAIANLSFESLDEPTITVTRQRIFDTLAATAIGLNTPEGKALQAIDVALVTPPLARRVAEQIRLYVGATRTTEIDDIDIVGATTVGSVVVPVALTLASASNDNGRKLIAAVVAGYEAMVRLGRAIGGATILYRGLWPTYATAAFGAAATAAKLLECDAQTTSCALALALEATDVPPTGAFVHAESRYDALGRAAAVGAAAASAAATGIGADPDAFENFAARLGIRVEKDELARYKEASGRIREIDIRMFPISRQALASVEALLSLAADIGNHEDIERIIVHVPGTYRDMVDRPELPSQRIESMIGIQYAMALALLRPDALYDTLRSSLASDEPIASLIAKIDVRASSQLDTFFPQAWGSTVTVHLKPGRVATQEVLEPSGGRSRPLEWRKLGRKVARLCAASGLGNAQYVNRLLEGCRMIAEDADTGRAVELMALIEAATGWNERVRSAAGPS
jgi:2-methylcitrate dehydratase PrpD